MKSRHVLTFMTLVIGLTWSSVKITKVAATSRDDAAIAQNRQLVPKHFANALTQLQENLDLIKSLPSSAELYSYSITNDINFQNLVVKTLKGAIELPMPNVSQTCLEQIETLVDGVKHYQEWALKVIDAFGKPTSGILLGSLMWLGEFGECKNATNDNDWHGKYCILAKPDFTGGEILGAPPSLKLGICIPSACNNQDIANLINFGIEMLPKSLIHLLPFNLTTIDSRYVTCDEPRELSSAAVAAIVVFSVIAALVLAGTLCDLYKVGKSWYASLSSVHDINGIINDDHSRMPSDEEKLTKGGDVHNDSIVVRVLLSFSLYTNTIKLFKITKSQDQLDCLHALRFFSIAWVVLGHSYIYTMSFADNQAIALDWFKRFSFTIVTNAYFSVDNFFLFSGLLTSYLFMKETSKRKLSVPLMIKYYLHRIWRITPTYGLVILFSYALTPYLGDGPMYPSNGFEALTCSKYWWTNLLYVNNFGNYSIESCLPVGWYLANDMQFHFIAPLILIPLALNKRAIAFAITTLLLVAHFIVITVIVVKNPGFELGMSGSVTSLDFFKTVYVTPWCRIGPFLVGIVLGYLLYVQKKKNFRLSLFQSIMGWIATITFLLFDLFIIYPNYDGHPLAKWFNIIYQATSRTFWGVGLAYVIFACSTSSGGFINKFLTLPIWTPLSRLSFSIYLIHTTILLYYNASLEHLFHLQDSTVIYAYVGHMTFATCAAYLVSMFIEVPIIGLEKFIFGRH